MDRNDMEQEKQNSHESEISGNAFRLSIVIPVYNGAQYIENLFAEIEKQNFNSLEVIFVDDGSADDSSKKITEKINETCKKWSERKSVIRLIREENKGQGGARNTGMIAASGKWLMFIDQDDRLENDYFEQMYLTAEKDNCDILISGYAREKTDGRREEKVILKDTSWSKYMNITPWGKIFRTSFLKDKNIRFYPTPLGEDIYFSLLAYSETDRIRISSYVGYIWVDNRKSVSNTTHKTIDPSASMLTLFDKISESVPKLDYADPETVYFLLKTAIFHILYVSGSTPYQEVIRYKDDLFHWLDIHCKGFRNNPLIRLNKPDGERQRVRFVVWTFMKLDRTGLLNRFLKMFHQVRK